MDFEKLHVITVISNPIRYKSRVAIYKKFAEHMKESGVELWTVECAFGKREFEVTDINNPRHIQFRTFDEIWHKENLINLGVARITSLYPGWKYVAWIDADITFLNRDWAKETWNALQHYHVAQLFQNAIDLGPTGQTLSTFQSFMYCHIAGIPIPQSKGYPFPHSGYAWAATRYAWDKAGGLLDRCILGSADHHMALALINKAKHSYPSTATDSYKDMILSWQDRALEFIKMDVGYVPGTIAHIWHGKKKTRYYQDRWKILVKHKYEPYKDLVRDSQGILLLDERRVGLRDDIRAYFRSRLEDSIDEV